MSSPAPYQPTPEPSGAAKPISSDNPLFSIFNKATEIQNYISREITLKPINRARDKVLMALNRYKGHGTPDEEDALFREHTWLVERLVARDGIDNRDPIELWENILFPHTKKIELAIGRKIHKGAPLYNCGLCLFLAHDFESALSYFKAAAEEDARSRKIQELPLIIGKHKLSRQVLIEPLIRDLMPAFSADYKSITINQLDENEFVALLSWIAVRDLRDALPILTALHSLLASKSNPVNEASGARIIGALRDLHVVIESTLIRLNIGSGTLFPRMKNCISANAQASSAFNNLHSVFTARYPIEADRHSVTALDFILNRATIAFSTSNARYDLSGIASYTAVRIRNGISHNNEVTDLHRNPNLALQMAGWALATLRTVKHVNENTF